MKKYNFHIFQILVTILVFMTACDSQDQVKRTKLPTSNPPLQTKETQSPVSSQIASMAINVYREFMEGKRTGKYEDGRTFSINDEYFSHTVQYSFYDYGHDGIPKLIMDSNDVNGTKILTYDYENDQILFLTGCSEYDRILSNDSFLYVRYGGAPDHIDYQYDEFNPKDGSYHRISFSKYKDPDNDDGDNDDAYHRFFFEDDEISAEEWEEKVSRYLTIPLAEITWYQTSDKQTEQSVAGTVRNR